MASVKEEETKLLWKPRCDRATKMDEFREFINRQFGLKFKSYEDLRIWSVECYADFWKSLWQFSQVIHSQPYTKVVDISQGINQIPEWFSGSRLNFAENVLQHQDDSIALYTAGEGQSVKTVTFCKLRENVARIASALKKLGIKKGDRIVGYLPNCALAVEAMLATTSLGAVWSSTSPDFGASAVLDRFQQIKPRMIFSVNAVRYNGKIHDHLTKLSQVVQGLPELEYIIVLPFVGPAEAVEISNIPNCMKLSEFLQLADESPELSFEQLPFNHPLFIMYSSGTTGPPKCMVHSVGGTLLQHYKEHVLHGNITRSDVVFYFTTTGWMMWNWLVSALVTGASVVLYDGSPFVPTANVLWDLVDEIGFSMLICGCSSSTLNRVNSLFEDFLQQLKLKVGLFSNHRITVFGTGAKWISTIDDKKLCPRERNNLRSLHTILSTGSPLKPASFDYVYRCIKEDVLLGSIAGGTDIISCFVGQNPVLPVYRGEIQARNLGMAVESWNGEGKPVYDESGELVCLKPFPSMPVYFWNDPSGLKYQKAYFSKFKGVWTHGDFCTISSTTGGIVMLGRSDGTLNPSGVRFGSAEIYNIVERFEEVEDSLCVGQLIADGSERVILFLKMKNGYRLDEPLLSRLKSTIRSQLSPRHVPAVILETKEIPYTSNGKKVEVAVKRVLAGENVRNRSSLRNPNSLDLFYNIPELQLT